MSSTQVANIFGVNAGQKEQQERAIAMGRNAGQYRQGSFSVAVGSNAGQVAQGQSSVAMGRNAGQDRQGQSSVALGFNAGQMVQGQSSVALGFNAGQTDQGAYAVALGFRAGQTAQPDHSIVINASGSAVNGTTAGGFFVVPVRKNCGDDDDNMSPLFYNAQTGEITYQILNKVSNIDDMGEEHEEQQNMVNSCCSNVATAIAQLSQQIDELRKQNATLRESAASASAAATYVLITDKPKKLMALNFYDINSVRGQTDTIVNNIFLGKTL